MSKRKIVGLAYKELLVGYHDLWSTKNDNKLLCVECMLYFSLPRELRYIARNAVVTPPEALLGALCMGTKRVVSRGEGIRVGYF